MILTGKGAYEGLTALLAREDHFLEEVGITFRFEGIIFEGDPSPHTITSWSQAALRPAAHD